MEAAPPSASTIHAVADWLELACLASPDGYIGLAELAEERKRQEDTGQASDQEGAALVLDVMDDPEDSDDGILPSQGDQNARSNIPADVDLDEALRTLADPEVSGEAADILIHLHTRLAMLREARYPFEIDKNALRLRNQLGAAHGVYIALLLCSNLNRLPKARRNEWTGGFERYCSHAMSGWLGEHYSVEVFGTAAQAGERFHGDTRLALHELCVLLGWTLMLDDEEAAQLSPSGDRGLDAVAWRSDADDPADLWVTYFLQAGCGKDWPGKQDEVSLERLGRFIGVKGPLQSVLAIPYWPRTNTKRWHKSFTLARTNVLLDRFRLLGLAADVASYLEFPTKRVQAAIVRDAGRQAGAIPTSSPQRRHAQRPKSRRT
jgi:hypothetical protein